MFVIPPANTADRISFNNTLVGTINREDGGFECLECSPVEDQDDPCETYGVNIAPYSQRCAVCGQLIVSGGTSTELFGSRLSRKDYQVLLNSLKLAMVDLYDDERKTLQRLSVKLTIMIENLGGDS